MPQGLTRYPLQSVALNGATTLLPGDDAIAIAGGIRDIGEEAKDQRAVGDSLPARARCPHVTAAPQPKSSFHTERVMIAGPPAGARQRASQADHRARTRDS